MGKLQLYMFRQLFWWTILVAGTLTCVVWLTQSLRFVEMIVNRGLSFTTFLMFTMLLLPSFLSLIGPVSLFAATVFTYNKMMTDSELVVQSASGMSPGSIGRPAIVLALILTAIGYVNSLYLMPASFRDFKDLQRSFRTEFSAVFLQEGVFNPVADGITVFIRERSSTGELFGLIIHDERKADEPVTMMAERGAIVASEAGPRIVLANGNRQEVGENDGRLSLLYFNQYTFDLSGLQRSETDFWREPRERYIHELIFPADQADAIYNYRKLRMEGLFRLATPLLYPAFVLVALALLLRGSFSRRGQLGRVLYAVGTVVALQVFVLSMKSMGEKVPEVEALVYASPIATIAVFSWLLFFARPRRNPVMDRPAGGAVGSS